MYRCSRDEYYDGERIKGFILQSLPNDEYIEVDIHLMTCVRCQEAKEGIEVLLDIRSIRREDYRDVKEGLSFSQPGQSECLSNASLTSIIMGEVGDVELLGRILHFRRCLTCQQILETLFEAINLLARCRDERDQT